MSTPVAYPVTVEGELDAGLSRWLWLVKLLLVIPHLIILFFSVVGVLHSHCGRLFPHPFYRPLSKGYLRLLRGGSPLDLAR